ncbi:phage pre-tape measure protein [Aquamicrobium zhengzhouense]|uniref:Uncharacterized protein n=1 Tax=Aquamicrobium zhengzhouense TaxID=2781738 RepID=A0ABS0SB55_9HYPH|nr:hypothetical protein [Aquamicrobium zhengzhouense]MBI1620019.1 hypothetical protein [Aquamicrobium zhengzhouense]
MALKYTVKTKDVKDGDEVVGSVHGLSFNAIVGLINLNREVVETLFNKFSGREAESITDTEISAVGMEMLETAPLFVAQVIAEATDAFDGYDPKDENAVNPLDTIMSMPLGLQLAFLQEIMPLTFNAGGGVKKMLALALKASQGASQSGN